MKWFIVIILNTVNANGIADKQEAQIRVAYSTQEECEMMAPQVATDFFEKTVITKHAEMQGVIVSYRCEMEKVLEEAVWKNFKL